ncbi:gamma-glutamylcyclotransferase family protein [Acutalibacter caecimuris]|uniref:gamma-glutamylcyclotransferase family protein n=1 Tax=Acutalibacter caecimuris TaxID=3093657 RepID=UPI002AC94F53|nr:gamma-glutamylcyclotransferase family protein [Acutalibacter sp. M00118]
MAKRYYIAYGSNLNVRQMRVRCPHATFLGTANLKGWELLFKGSKTGSYLTIEECKGGTVPVVVWEVTESDEAALDLYEGAPTFYYKRNLKIQYKGIRTGRRRTVTAFVYIMHEERPIDVPTSRYMRTCLEGYDTFNFDKKVLVAAYDKCREVCGYEG